LDKQFDRAEEAFEKLSGHQCHARSIIFKPKDFYKKALDFSIVELSVKPFRIAHKFEFYIQPQPSFNKQFDLLLNNLSENQFNGYKTICFVLMRHKKRFHDIFESLDETNAENIRKV
jgi:transcription-repair coupling factor (superfamily II helicase)